MVTVDISGLKDPRQAVPVDAWKDFIEDDVGLFPARLKELLKAFYSNQLIPFKELLKIFCGGSLVHPCSFCATSLTVEAVERELRGGSVPTVSLQPHMTEMYCCGAPACKEEMVSKLNAWEKWRAAVALTTHKLKANRCNFCFKQSDVVHR